MGISDVVNLLSSLADSLICYSLIWPFISILCSEAFSLLRISCVASMVQTHHATITFDHP
jgi:hypothetical protein